MKQVICLTLFILSAVTGGLYGQKESRKITVRPDTIAADTVEYRLIIFDVGFDAWLSSKPSMNFHSRHFYETRNRDYVMAWNQRATNPSLYGGDYENLIEYDPYIDYGLELNYRLYYYFLFFEEVNNVKLLNSNR